MGRALFRFRVAAFFPFFAIAAVWMWVKYKHPDDLPSSPLTDSLSDFTSHDTAFIICGVLSIIAFAIRAAGEARLGSVVYGQGAGTRIVTSGPFRFSRNPLYIGVLMFFVATTAPHVSLVLVAVLTIAFAATLRSIVVYEEGTLVTALGAPYQRYLDAVPRFLGIPKPVDSDGIKVTGAAWLYASAGNLGILSLGVYRLLDAAGVMFRGMRLLSVSLFMLWLAIILVRRVLAK